MCRYSRPCANSSMDQIVKAVVVISTHTQANTIAIVRLYRRLRAGTKRTASARRSGSKVAVNATHCCQFLCLLYFRYHVPKPVSCILLMRVFIPAGTPAAHGELSRHDQQGACRTTHSVVCLYRPKPIYKGGRTLYVTNMAAAFFLTYWQRQIYH